ncbi:SIMPL domain-containing protein [Massilia horti]|uniref:DUF541 domain-containing protein n=1 Tax=Massilia horti TaxID=2562153 RepID=A0A4Y9SYJ0_9BURK|nr:SIMPL domain-containing protein [Massilia horti]TFW31714.1 DUF541 domain-containing protein [Massilia horti]
MSRMKMFLLAGLILGCAAAQAQTGPAAATSGTMVIVPAHGEVKHPNDQAVLVLSVEEFDKDKTAAAARVNQKMKQGVEIVRREDPQADLKTQGYFTMPVYPENPPQPLTQPGAKRLPIGWRVGQYLEVKTTNLNNLPRTAAAAQKLLQINSLEFGLSPELARRLDDQRIAATYRNLNERIASIANAMGRKVTDAVIDTVDFEASGRYMAEAAAAPMQMRAQFGKRGMDEVPEPSFEPGETTLQMNVVGKVRFK